MAKKTLHPKLAENAEKVKRGEALNGSKKKKTKKTSRNTK